ELLGTGAAAQREAGDRSLASLQTSIALRAKAPQQSAQPWSLRAARRRTRARRANGDHLERRARVEWVHGRSDGDRHVRCGPAEIPTGPTRSPHAEPRAAPA